MDLTGRMATETERRLNRAVQANGAGYAAIKGAIAAGKALMWGNIDDVAGRGPTPEQAVALLGTDAAAWFMAAKTAARSIAIADLSASGVKVPTEEQITAASPEVMPSTWAYTINPDGTVTLTRP